MKYIFTCCLFALSTFAISQVSKENVQTMLDQMVKDNVISAEEAQKAKIKMQTMNPEQWNNLNNKADGIASRMPASVPSTQPSPGTLEGAQLKQIQEDMKKIMPESRH